MRTASLITTLALSLVSASAFTQQNPQTVRNYGKLPLSFEMNKGQTDKRVNFMSRGAGYALFLTPNEAVFSLSKPQAKPKNGKKCAPVAPSVLRMKLLGANPNPKAVGEAKLSGTVNYFKGNDPKKWHTNIGTYGKVRYQSVYRGIDQVFYGNQRKLEYDFVVSPFADYKQVKMEFAGAKSVKLLKSGALELKMKGGSVKWEAPLIYQEANGKRTKVAGKYVLLGKRRVGFEVARYDHSKPLVIDPVLVYSTFLSSAASNFSADIKVDSTGNTYIVGRIASNGNNFPTTSGAYDTTNDGTWDVFVSKINPTASALIYSTYLGGNSEDFGSGIAIDASGNAYITGTTWGNFPTTAGAYDTSFNGNVDAFITKLNASGTALVYSTYLGGTDWESDPNNTLQDAHIAIDTDGNAYVTGPTASTNFPTTPGAYDTTHNGIHDAFVAKLNSSGSALTYSTFLGGSATDVSYGIVVDTTGNAYVTGYTQGNFHFPTTSGAFDTSANGVTDVFVTKLSADGSSLVYSTYLGGNSTQGGAGIAVDNSGNAYVTGSTSSSNFPTTAGAFDRSFNGNGTDDVFVTKINANGTALIYSTLLGGSGYDLAHSLAVDASGNAYIIGSTDSTNFPKTTGTYDTSHNGSNDVFVSKLTANGSTLLYSTYLGGNDFDEGYGIAVDSLGDAYVTGWTQSGSFPVTISTIDPSPSPGSGSIFITKFALSRVLSLSVPAITTAYEAKPVIQATLLRPDNVTPYPDKLLVFKLNGTTIKSMKTNANGVSAFNYELGSTPLGNYTLTVSYVGDANYEPITTTTTLRILRSGVKFVLGSGIAATKYRLGFPMSPVLSFTMTRLSDNAKLANETFGVELDGATIGTVTTDANGVATLPYTPPASLGAGSKVLKALYTATTNYNGLTAGWNLSFSKTPTGITAPSVTGNKGTSVNLTATLTNKDTTAPLEGKTLHFFVGGVEVGTGVTNANGIATLPYTLPNTVGKLTLIINYDGEDLLANSSRQTLITVR